MTSCAQLFQRLQLLENLYQHVFDPIRRGEIAKQISQLIEQMRVQGCYLETDRMLGGSVKACSDPPYLRPEGSSFAARLSIINSTGAVTCSLDPFSIGHAKITQATDPGAANSGVYDFASGALDIHIAINVQVGSLSEASDLFLATDVSLPTPCMGTLSGSPAGNPANVTGPIRLVGSSQVSALGKTATLYVDVQGVLS